MAHRRTKECCSLRFLCLDHNLWHLRRRVVECQRMIKELESGQETVRQVWLKVEIEVLVKVQNVEIKFGNVFGASEVIRRLVELKRARIEQ